MTVWKPDTCDCKIEYDDNVNFVKSYNKCNLHKSIPDGPGLLNAVLAHNRGFGRNLSNPPTDQELDDNAVAKAVEKQRIRNL